MAQLMFLDTCSVLIKYEYTNDIGLDKVLFYEEKLQSLERKGAK